GGAGSLGAGGAAAGAERGAAIGRMGCQCRGGSMELSRALRCSRSRVRVPGRRRWGDTVALSPALVLAARLGTGAGCVGGGSVAIPRRALVPRIRESRPAGTRRDVHGTPCRVAGVAVGGG